MNLILERTEQVPYFTDIRLMLDALGVCAADYDWYISDIETNYYGTDFHSEDQWICGQQLSDFLQNNDVQFIWAVFSAVPTGHRSAVEEVPYVEGNPNYWKGTEPMPQLAGALFEIACWDSSATIFIGLPAEMEASLIRAYPETRPLIGAR